MPSPLNRRRAAWIVGLLVVVAIPLIPSLSPPVDRDAELDIELVRTAEARYRGITASFDELTRAYALTTYETSEFLEWTSQPNQRHPETQALVTARFRVGPVRGDAPAAGDDTVADYRAGVEDVLEVTWRLNTMSSVDVQAHSPLAQDALVVFQRTVDGLLDRMHYLAEATDLRDGPAGAVTTSLAPGTAVLLEETVDDWSRVRVPSDTLAGWVPEDRLRPVYAR